MAVFQSIFCGQFWDKFYAFYAEIELTQNFINHKRHHNFDQKFLKILFAIANFAVTILSIYAAMQSFFSDNKKKYI